jgi:hypothetical protein
MWSMGSRTQRLPLTVASIACAALGPSVVISGGGLLVVLLAPLLSGFGTLLDTLDGDVTSSFYGAFEGISHRVERS